MAGMDLSKEQVEKKLDKLSEEVTSFLASDGFDQDFDDLAERHELLEELGETNSLKQLIIAVLSGIIQPSDLSAEIKRFLYRDDSEAVSLSKDVLDILSPVLNNEPKKKSIPPAQPAPSAPKPQPLGQSKIIDFPASPPKLDSLPKPAAMPTPETAPTSPLPSPSAKQALPKRAEPQTPSTQAYQPKKITMSESPSPAPFIIHEEKESKRTSFDPSRPTFIKPQFGIPSSAGLPPERQPTVRVDFGKGIYNFGKPNPTPPLPTNVKRVDYTAPRTDQSPPPKKNDDQNTLDLRDLPK